MFDSNTNEGSHWYLIQVTEDNVNLASSDGITEEVRFTAEDLCTKECTPDKTGCPLTLTKRYGLTLALASKLHKFIISYLAFSLAFIWEGRNNLNKFIHESLFKIMY